MEISNFIKNLIYPNKCIFCKISLVDNNNISTCDTCYSNIYKEYFNTYNLAYKNIDKCISLLNYSGEVRDKIIKLKFRGKKHYHKIFSQFMCDYIKLNIHNIDFITYVPMHPFKEFKRGSGTTKLLAKYISKELNIPLLGTMNKKHTRVQSSLDAKARSLNVGSAYTIKANIDIQDKNLLLIDDVLTTGATVCACSEILKQFHAHTVTVLTIAK